MASNANLIVDDPKGGIFKVHRSSMTSQDILELEWEKVFERSWLYLGHEAEVPEPGDYRRRTLAGRPLFFNRGRDGQARAFLNTCPHRGALICRRDEGNSQVFQCFYHAWTFNSQGELMGVPDEAGYGEDFDKKALGLKPPPRVEEYRGFYFVSFNPDIEDLVSYLAGAREYLDLIVDQSDVGLKVIRGSNKYHIKANWKLLVENSLDGYHVFPTHQTYWEYMALEGLQVPKDRQGIGRSLGNGHSVMENDCLYGRPIAYWNPIFGEEAKEEIAEIRARLKERHGQERAKRMAEKSRNLLIFPNLIINDTTSITVRQFWPTAPDNMEVTAWEMATAEESGHLLARRLDNFLTFLGPGGFATPDDTEALESCQMGFSARELEWSDVSRGMKRVPQGKDELQIRTFWRRWNSLISGIPYREEPELGPAIAEERASLAQAGD
jgi:p-cumate 2,3-dioxygenase alpha subunit